MVLLSPCLAGRTASGEASFLYTCPESGWPVILPGRICRTPMHCCIGPSRSLRVSHIVRSQQHQLQAHLAASLNRLTGVGARQQVGTWHSCMQIQHAATAQAIPAAPYKLPIQPPAARIGTPGPVECDLGTLLRIGTCPAGHMHGCVQPSHANTASIGNSLGCFNCRHTLHKQLCALHAQ